MTSDSESEELNGWLRQDYDDLTACLADELRNMVAQIEASASDVYGYAILPPDLLTAWDPTTMGLVFNRESDLPDGLDPNSDPLDYRYLPAEWQNWGDIEAFPRSNERLRVAYERFKSAQPKSELTAPDGQPSVETKRQEDAYAAKIDRAVLAALVQLRADATVGPEVCVLIWCSHSEREIILDSARLLNNSDVYEQFRRVLEP